MSTNDSPYSGTEGTIPVDQAMEMAANWRTYLDASQQAFNVRSYWIPIVDFQNILRNNPTAEAVRAFIGLTDPTDPTTSQLLLVPIVEGKEVYYLTSNKDGAPGDPGDDDDSNVYDLTQPCPPACGGSGTSPMDGKK